MKYGGNTFEKHEKLIQVSLFLTSTIAKSELMQRNFTLKNCSTVHAVCECHALQQLHVLHGYLMLRMRKFQYKTTMGKHIMVT